MHQWSHEAMNRPPVGIAHIITKLELGGAQLNTLFTVEHLDPVHYRRILITGEQGLLDERAARLPGVEWYRIPSMSRRIQPVADLRAFVALRRLLSDLNPTIVHTHSSKAGILGRWAARSVGVPVIVHTVHGYGFQAARWIRSLLVWIERHTMRITTRVITVSEAVREQGITMGLFSADRAEIIRSGIDLDMFRTASSNPAQMKEALGLHPQKPVVGMVAPLKPQKAPVDFVRMACLVAATHPDVQFLLVGDGELRGAVEAEIKQSGLTDRVFLAGWRHDIPAVMGCLDVFVLTSRWEGLPRVYLEALSSGVPVIGTAVDGAPEVIRDGFNGYLVAPGDVKAMAARVSSLLADRHLRACLGRNGPGLSKAFDCWTMLEQQVLLYEGFLKELG